MGKLMGNMDNLPVPGSSFQYSAVRIEDLGASEYTLVTVAVDLSTSVGGFRDDLVATLKEIVKACQKNARADYLLMRVLGFNDSNIEVQGFKLLSTVDMSDFDSLSTGGCTALFDASYDAVSATAAYSKSLVDQDFDTNGVVYVITDGCDNRSKMRARQIAEAKKGALVKEEIESLQTILIGVNINNNTVKNELLQFEIDGEFDQFIALEDASSDTLAKVGGFVSRSISSQSLALGTGGPSQPLALT